MADAVVIIVCLVAAVTLLLVAVHVVVTNQREVAEFAKRVEERQAARRCGAGRDWSTCRTP
jgi:uncharacterized membrane-anchored protein